MPLSALIRRGLLSLLLAVAVTSLFVVLLNGTRPRAAAERSLGEAAHDAVTSLVRAVVGGSDAPCSSGAREDFRADPDVLAGLRRRRGGDQR